MSTFEWKGKDYPATMDDIEKVELPVFDTSTITHSQDHFDPFFGAAGYEVWGREVPEWVHREAQQRFEQHLASFEGTKIIDAHLDYGGMNFSLVWVELEKRCLCAWKLRSQGSSPKDKIAKLYATMYVPRGDWFVSRAHTLIPPKASDL